MPIEQTNAEFEKTVAASGVPEPLSAVDLFVKEFHIKAMPTNSAEVRFGYSAGNGTQKWPLLPTEWTSRHARPGKVINLKSVYVDVNVNGEGVIINYTTP